MSTPYYKPKRKADLIDHLIREHQRDHVVSGPNGSRTATYHELERLYGRDWQTADMVRWTVADLTERHDTYHNDRSV
jgi:hypothetical protein